MIIRAKSLTKQHVGLWFCFVDEQDYIYGRITDIKQVGESYSIAPDNPWSESQFTHSFTVDMTPHTTYIKYESETGEATGTIGTDNIPVELFPGDKRSRTFTVS